MGESDGVISLHRSQQMYGRIRWCDEFAPESKERIRWCDQVTPDENVWYSSCSTCAV